jgi:hypothetical protein
VNTPSISQQWKWRVTTCAVALRRSRDGGLVPESLSDALSVNAFAAVVEVVEVTTITCAAELPKAAPSTRAQATFLLRELLPKFA